MEKIFRKTLVGTYLAVCLLVFTITPLPSGFHDNGFIFVSSAFNVIPKLLWNQTFGGAGYQDCFDVIQTSDGGFALVGLTSSYGAGGRAGWLVKTDANGTMEWNQSYGGVGDDSFSKVIPTSDGGLAIAGSTFSYGAGEGDLWLVKMDAKGNILWNQTYGGPQHDNAGAVLQTSDGGFVLAGYTKSYGAGYYDFWLIKTDATGVTQWSQTYGGPSSDHLLALTQTLDGGFALFGDTKSYGVGGSDLWLVKTDAAGAVQWNQTYGTTEHEEGRVVIQTGDGGFALAGSTSNRDWYDVGPFSGTLRSDFLFVRTDANGMVQWNQTYGGTGYDRCFDAVQTLDGGFALFGEIPSHGTDFWVVKTDATGTIEWNQNYGYGQVDVCFAGVQTREGDFVLGGITFSSETGYDLWLIRIGVPEPASSTSSRISGLTLLPLLVTVLVLSWHKQKKKGQSNHPPP
ncbi:MAG: hypothetical protein ACFFBD_03135 [Candidatus Hodarchaeota archaeon]